MTSRLSRGIYQPILAFLVIVFMAIPHSANAADTPALWKLEGKNNTIWLFGSIHALSHKVHYPKAIMDAFHSSKYMAVETDMHAQYREADAIMDKKMWLKPGWTLQHLISDETYQMIKSYAHYAGLDMNIVNRMAPWSVAWNLTSQGEIGGKALEGDMGVETYFTNKAHGYGKTIVELETLDEHMDVITNIPVPMAEKLIKRNLKNPVTWIQYGGIGRTEKLWRAGTLEENWDDEEARGDVNGWYERLLVNRNKKWTDKIINEWLQDDEDYFVIGGAAHFTGPDSVIQMLKQKGYVAKRVWYHKPHAGQKPELFD